MYRKLTIVIFTILFSTLSLTAAENAKKNSTVITKPVNAFLEFRQHILNEDYSSVTAMLDGTIRADVEKDGIIPFEMIRQFAAITAAYENTSVRAADSTKAQIRAVFTKNAEDLLLVLDMTDDHGRYRIEKISVTRNTPDLFFQDFVRSCAAGNINQTKQFLSPAMKEKFSSIPDSLSSGSVKKISPANTRGTTAEFTVTLNYTSGKISMVKDQFFWRVSAISPQLSSPAPWVQMNKFFSTASASQSPDKLAEFFTTAYLNKLTAVPPAPQAANGEEPQSPAAEPAVTFTPVQLEVFSALKNKMTAENFKNSGNSVVCSIALQDISSSVYGNMKLIMTFESNLWKISSADWNNITGNSPAQTVSAWFKALQSPDKLSEAQAMMSDPSLLEQKQIPTYPADAAVTIDNTAISGNMATVTVSVRTSPDSEPETSTKTLVLKDSRWIITGI